MATHGKILLSMRAVEKDAVEYNKKPDNFAVG